MSKKNKRDKVGVPKGYGVDYTKISSRHLDDKRYEREKAFAESGREQKNGTQDQSQTYNAFMRLQMGQEEATISEKLANNSNRPTWETFKKENKDQLNIAGEELRERLDYRRVLDEERRKRFTNDPSIQKTKNLLFSDDEEEGNEEVRDDEERKKKRKKKKSSKKKKKKKKRKKRKSQNSSPTSSEEDDSNGKDNS